MKKKKVETISNPNEDRQTCYVCGRIKGISKMRYLPGCVSLNVEGKWKCDSGTCESGGKYWMKYQASLPEEKQSEFYPFWKEKKDEGIS